MFPALELNLLTYFAMREIKYTRIQRLVARILLTGFFLQSCYNPNTSIEPRPPQVGRESSANYLVPLARGSSNQVKEIPPTPPLAPDIPIDTAIQPAIPPIERSSASSANTSLRTSTPPSIKKPVLSHQTNSAKYVPSLATATSRLEKEEYVIPHTLHDSTTLSSKSKASTEDTGRLAKHVSPQAGSLPINKADKDLEESMILVKKLPTTKGQEVRIGYSLDHKQVIAYVIDEAGKKELVKPEDMPKELFAISDALTFKLYIELFKHPSLIGDGIEVHRALQILRTYSLIESAKLEDHVQVHRLVQAVTRDKHKREEQEEVMVKELVALKEAIRGFYPIEKLKEEDYDKTRRLLPHLESLVANIEAYQVAKEGSARELALSAAELYWMIGDAANAFGDYSASQRVHERAVLIKEKHYGKDHVEVASTLVNLGNAVWNLGDYQGAKELFERALVIEENHYGKDHVKVAITLENLGSTVVALGDSPRSKELYERALVIKEKHYGKDHVQVASTLVNLGNAVRNLGDYQGSRELLERALAIQEKHYGKDHVNVAITLANLGNAVRDLGESPRSKELFERALVIEENHYGKDHVKVAITLENLGSTVVALGDSPRSKELLGRALLIKEKHYGKDHVQVASTLVNLGNAVRNLGDSKGSRELLERALAIQEKHYGKDHAALAITLYNLSFTYEKMKDISHALEVMQRSYQIAHANKLHNISTYANRLRRIEQLVAQKEIKPSAHKQKEK